MSRGRVDRCADCGRVRHMAGRGLCNRCYRRHVDHGTHIDFPRTNMPADDVLDDYELLASEGHSRRQIADRLGMTKEALDKALARHRDDPRAQAWRHQKSS